MEDIRNDFYRGNFTPIAHIALRNLFVMYYYYTGNEFVCFKNKYVVVYGFYLTDMIRGDTSGSMESLMVAMAEVGPILHII